MFGHELLLKGLVRSIGDGRQTLIFLDCWLFNNGPCFPIPRQRSFDTNLRVFDLIISGIDVWDDNLLRELFYDANRALISRIQTSRFFRDGYYWAYTPSGSYTVKSGYKLPQDSETHLTDPLPPLEKAMWSKIWKVKAAPKIKHFLCRCLSGALAVKDRLCSRGMNINPQCQTCGGANETIVHVLFHCPLAAEAWERSRIQIPPNGFHTTSTFLNFHFLVNHDPNGESHPFLWLLWQIWKARNGLVCEQSPWTANFILQRAKDDFFEWETANPTDQIPKSPSTPQRWRKPVSPFVKCNIANSWINQTQLSGTGWLLRNHEGLTLFHGCNVFASSATKLHAELEGFLWAACCLADLHVTNIIFEVSDLQLVEAIKHPTHFRVVRALLGKIFMVLRSLQSWSCTFVVPTGNKMAGSIATSITKEH